MKTNVTVRNGNRLTCTRTWTFKFEPESPSVRVEEWEIVDSGETFWAITRTGETLRLRCLSEEGGCTMALYDCFEGLGTPLAYANFGQESVPGQFEKWSKRWKKKVASGDLNYF